MPNEKDVVTGSVHKTHKRTHVVLAILVLCLVLFGSTANAPVNANMQQATLGDKKFVLKVVTSDTDIRKGLSGTTKISSEEGMLFVFDKPNTACFWMKDMHYNLDIFWFDASNTLIYQQNNLSPNTYPQKYCPPTEASRVVEINPGLVQLKLGDYLQIQKQ